MSTSHFFFSFAQVEVKVVREFVMEYPVIKSRNSEIGRNLMTT